MLLLPLLAAALASPIAAGAQTPEAAEAPPAGETATMAQEPGQQRGTPASYVSSDDYPPEAIAAGHEGFVKFELTVGVNGRARACRIVQSSGSDILDAHTCKLMQARARFRPATDEQGLPVEDRIQAGIHWTLP